MQPGGIHHVSVCVPDVDAAVGFYTDVLGFVPIPRPEALGPGAWLDAGGAQLHLLASDEARSAADHFAVRVDDLDAAVAEIRTKGVRVDPVPAIAGVGRQAFLHDPAGNLIELNQPDA